MRLILEKSEIVAILGKHFDAELDPEKVIIRTDPFEIEVCGLPLAADPAPSTNVVAIKPPAKRTGVDAPKFAAQLRDDEGASTEEPPPGLDGAESSEDSVHPSSVLAASKALEQQLEKENPQLKRRSGNFSFNAPTDPSKEV